MQEKRHAGNLNQAKLKKEACMKAHCAIHHTGTGPNKFQTYVKTDKTTDGNITHPKAGILYGCIK